MVVEFSVRNFRSIDTLQTISFKATGLRSSPENEEVDRNNIVEDGGVRLLKTVGVYGANASGKSNLIRALISFIQAIKNEPSAESNLSHLCDPFLYQEFPDDSESYFQIVLVLDNKKYRYGLTIKKNRENPEKGSRELVTGEWLYATKEKSVGEIFLRKNMEIKRNGMAGPDRIPEPPYPHTLFLTHAAAFDPDGAFTVVRRFLANWTTYNFSGGFETFRWNSISVIEIDKRKSEFLQLLSAFNLNYDDVIIEPDGGSPPDLTSQDRVYFLKTFRGTANRVPVRLNLRLNESTGTQKLFDIAGFLLRAFSLPVSGFILLDELDNNFHPSLLIKLIGLFNDSSVNESSIQVLFTTHDTNLLSPSLMRRDQIYFTEKGEDESTRVYSLADLKGIRNDADFARQYLSGHYGAVPILQNYLPKITAPHGGTLEY